MRIRRTLIALAFLWGMIHSGHFANLIWAQSSLSLELDANRVPWTNLFYRAKNFWVEVNTQLQMKSLPATEVEKDLLKNPRGVAIRASSPESYEITADTIINSVFQSPVKIVTQVWFDPKDAKALGRLRFRRGEDDFKKIYRFTQQGVFRHRREPRDKEEALQDPEKWTDIKDTFYSYDIAQLGCPNVSERLLLIYLASALEIAKNNKAISLCVFGKRQVHFVRLLPMGLHPLKIDYIEKRQQDEVHRQGKIDAFKIAIESEPLKSDLEEDENFTFLGFHKNIAVYIDPLSNLPVQVSGKIPKVGEAALKLHEVHVR